MFVLLVFLCVLLGAPVGILVLSREGRYPKRGFDLRQDPHGESAAYRWFNPGG
jgi:hypothetical protein